MTPTVETTVHTPRRAGVRGFLLLAFGLTWVFWIPMALIQRGTIDLPVPPLALAIVGSFGPMAAALIMAGRRSGATGLRALFSQLRLRGLDRRWLWIALATGLLDLSPALVRLTYGGPLPDEIIGQVLVVPVHFLFVAVAGGGLDEEMGWRGYAQPALQHRMPPLPANLLLGAIWAVWHLPLFFDPTSSQTETGFTVYLATVTAQAVIIGWLYNASGGSLLVAIVAHSAHDAADGLRFAITADNHAAADLQQLVVYVAAAIAVIALTHGRLGVRPAAGAPTMVAEQPSAVAP